MPKTAGAFEHPHAGRSIILATLDLRVPSAALEASVTEGVAPLEVRFDASASSTPPETGPLTYRWSFDNGVSHADLDGAVIDHVFDDSGRHLVTVEAMNALGLSRRRTREVLVYCPDADVSPWTSTDIGEPLVRGTARRSGDAHACLDVCGSGKFLTGYADSAQFTWKEFAGDGSVIARVDDWRGGTGGLELGVLLRDGLDADARSIGLTLRRLARTDAAVNVRLSHRDEAAERTQGRTLDRSDWTNRPVWLRLERVGSTITPSYRESESDEWIVRADEAVTVDLASRVFAGVVAIGVEPSIDIGFEALEATFCGVEVRTRASPAFRRSDTNADTEVNLTDAVHTLTWLFLGGPAPGCVAAANVNGDGAVDISDPVALLTYLFLGGPAPVGPWPGCGVSGVDADEGLGCVAPNCE